MTAYVFEKYLVLKLSRILLVSTIYLLLILGIVTGLMVCVEVIHGTTKQIDRMLKISGFSLARFAFVPVRYYFAQ